MSTPDTPPDPPEEAAADGRTKAVRKLGDALAEARQMLPLLADPRLNAVRAERLRVSVTRWLWFFLACGLGYTTAGVHDFLARGYTLADPMWWAAWLVEPAFAGILVTLLRWEAEMLARGLDVTASAVRRLKRLLLFSTLVMNVVPTLPVFDGVTFNLGSFFVHLVIPLIVFYLAEVMPVVQQMCTAAKTATTMTDTTNPTPEPAPLPAPEVPATAPALAPTTPSAPPAAPTPAPAHAPAPAPAPGRVRLPDDLAAKVAASITTAREQGRTPTVADVQAVVRLSDALAARVLADHTTNGHTVA
ncbi:hypothetical protein [Actinokineospora sp. UTMC 2448]|uniref:hypothetical protein n=1 Tax=Actinokineospora sp. UTMC 2448 TaxID=2268449 RepID=UPI0021642450|nr:hypothetical protein [Actinokineospora sp. UTMC 2448]UVS78370.1 hypothetical protein Actkin_02103 [Actinokineospora sp. UTMC 2448]